MSKMAFAAFKSTMQIVECAWFPADPDTVNDIRYNFKEGLYDDNSEILTADLKKDPALYSYCLRELILMLQKGKETLEVEIDPSQLFRKADPKLLRKILRDEDNALLTQSFAEMSEEQMLRIKELKIALATVELLAEHSKINGDVAYATAIMRQLGLCLISWNYPHIYSRALTRVKEGQALDESLAVLLGFSPALLGISMAKRWNLIPELRGALRDERGASSPDEGPDKKKALVSEALCRICQTGEMLARASAPEHYPYAEHEWEQASEFIQDLTGPEGLELIKKKVKENFNKYLEQNSDISSKIFQLPDSFKAKNKVNLFSFKGNKYIKACPKAVQQELEELYGRTKENAVLKDNILSLVKSVIPQAGFQSGCVYAYEPTLGKLIPRLTVGGVPLSCYEVIDCSPLSNDDNVMRKAFEANEAITAKNAWSPSHSLSIVSVYGFVQRAGVLYLETSPQLASSKTLDPLSVFKALNQALMDFLRLY